MDGRGILVLGLIAYTFLFSCTEINPNFHPSGTSDLKISSSVVDIKSSGMSGWDMSTYPGSGKDFGQGKDQHNIFIDSNKFIDAGSSGGNCTPGGNCSPTNPCRTGMFVCQGNKKICTELSDLPNGTSCGEALACFSGNCVSCGKKANQPCCGQQCDSQSFLTCTGGICEMCGKLFNQTCCDGQCDDTLNLICRNGRCKFTN